MVPANEFKGVLRMFGLFLPPDMPWGMVLEPILLVGACFIAFEAGLFIRRWHHKRRQSGLLAEAKVVLHTEGEGDALRGRRKSVRRRFKLVEVLVDVPNVPERPIRGYVINRSNGWLLLALAENVKAEQVLKVRANHAPKDSPWVALKVLHCSRLRKKYWRVWAQYLEELSVATQLLFG